MEARTRGEVILSAGSVGSTQILQLSGVGSAEALAAHGVAVVHDLPGVGQGAALFSDISGFTSMTETLTRESGQRRGVDELARVSECQDDLHRHGVGAVAGVDEREARRHGRGVRSGGGVGQVRGTVMRDCRSTPKKLRCAVASPFSILGA